MSKEFKKPDLNAPRYRPKKTNLLNKAFYEKFLDKYPKHQEISSEKLKEVVTKFNGAIWENVINSRDGVELPEQLGYIFIGTCPRKISANPNFAQSLKAGVMSQNQNWETDHHVAKIFYTNFETKYRFKFHELWGFTGVRDFKRTVSQTYPTKWTQYVVIDNMQHVSKLFRKQRYKQYKEQEKVITPDSYDEFAFD